MRSSRRTRAQPPSSSPPAAADQEEPEPTKVKVPRVTKAKASAKAKALAEAPPAKTPPTKAPAAKALPTKTVPAKTPPTKAPPPVKAASAPKAKSAPIRKAPTRGKRAASKKVEEKEDDETLVEQEKPTENGKDEPQAVQGDNEVNGTVKELLDDCQEEVSEAEDPNVTRILSSSPDHIDFKNFKLTKVINESTASKTITFQGTYDNKTAVMLLEKTLFSEAVVKKALVDKKTTATKDFKNDVYCSYIINPFASSGSINDIKATVVCPANESVLSKYSHSDSILFCENIEVYTNVVEPFIADKLASDENYNKWVYNILDGISEVDRVILNDPDPDSGFVLTPSLKWAGDEKDLYLVAICHRRDIRSLRDLDDKHMTLLMNILTKGTKAIRDRYKKNKSPLRAFIHYQPSFYHFHVHFKTIDPSDYRSTDRDNLLSTVISNITLNKDYYKKATLTYPLSVSSALHQQLKKAKRV